jgi:hypothetical protein
MSTRNSVWDGGMIHYYLKGTRVLVCWHCPFLQVIHLVLVCYIERTDEYHHLDRIGSYLFKYRGSEVWTLRRRLLSSVSVAGIDLLHASLGETDDDDRWNC